ncbi:twin arginine-targeting protein translocase TatC [Candidatus Epulonipiscium fishelsonii]|uniref:Twin arginine-targeting protein translocase TatC n=1 Tax=Candidatus Epulonipiscium fishelsonii TaxID=77094 RepID=A0ACC8XA80_9FIRM|nr:twin arginine-targeting protein translocase TatC [Epulopiscium sp. SCG-B11WGA-EpuloA1]ONI43496.1 twin arginine-targeting protein translocase TatC [Epulopiscium sp. SCG-B05WGA-EpuloA1]
METLKKHNNDDMPLLDHLSELRNRLKIVVIVNLIAMAVAFQFSEDIILYLLNLNPGMHLVYISPSELLMVYIQISVIVALIICSPVTLYQIWAFLEKGLKKQEKTYILISLFFGLICFILGVYFCYSIVLPSMLDFFLRLEISEITNMISISSYTSFINFMLFSFGVVFEMPVVIFILTKLNIISTEFLEKNRGISIVAIFIAATIITPPDVVSQLMLGLPMVVLLQISIAISKLANKSFFKKKENSYAK